MYAVWHGPEGLIEIARETNRKTATLAAGLRRLGFRILNESFFDTITVQTGERQAEIIARGLSEKLNFRVATPGECGPQAALGVTLDETTTTSVVEAVWRAFGGALNYDEMSDAAACGLPAGLSADIQLSPASGLSSLPLRNGVDALYAQTQRPRSGAQPGDDSARLMHHETERHDRIVPITWPEFDSLHPFAPADQARGYQEMFEDLKRRSAR